MSVLLIAGSPSERSRSSALLEAVAQRLRLQGRQSETLLIRELPAQALLQADFGHPGISQALGRVARAEFLVVATPVYKAAYSGVLKVFLDLLPQTGLAGKTVLPLATGGSANHMLALDYALRPVLQSLGARQVLGGIYATDAQVSLCESGAYQLSDEIGQRLDAAVETLLTDRQASVQGHSRHFAPLQFGQVRCSV
jgi:FMN reductase